MKNYQIHHQEQMEARRRDFAIFWETIAKPALRDLQVPRLFWPAVQHIAWSAFSSRPQ